MQKYTLNAQFLQFVNILCTQLHIRDRLRVFLYAIIALSNNPSPQTQIHIKFSDLQQSLADFSTDAEKKHITQAQLLKLFYLLANVQERLKISLVQFKLELDETGDNDTVLVTLDILNRYTEVINYINSKLDGEFSIDTLVVAVNELFPNSLGNCVVERCYQPTYAKTKRKLEKIPNLFTELVKLGKTEGIDVDEIQREMTEIAAKINVDVMLACEELEIWDRQQREILKKEQEQNQQIAFRNQQFNLNNHNSSSENADNTDNNSNQQTVKQYAQELKQQYQQHAPHWYHLATNSIDANNKNNKNSKNNIGNNKQTDKHNKQTNNINNISTINHNINNSIQLNSDLIASSYLNHYT